MFARLLEMSVKADKKPELIKKMREEALPILRKYKGFIDVIPLEVETEPAMFYAISLWYEKSNAEKYDKERELRHSEGDLRTVFDDAHGREALQGGRDYFQESDRRRRLTFSQRAPDNAPALPPGFSILRQSVAANNGQLGSDPTTSSDTRRFWIRCLFARAIFAGTAKPRGTASA